MQIGPWQFSPKLWPTLCTLGLFPVLLSLGFWQLDRADQKEALQKDYETRTNAVPVNLENVDESFLLNGDEMRWRHVVLEGSYRTDKQFLLDNQTMRNEAGYLVYTPFRLAHRNVVVLVNRGWVPVGPDRTHAPQVITPGNSMTVQGVAKLPPSPGIILGEAQAESMENGFIRLQYLDLGKLGKSIGAPLLPYVVRLEGDNEEGFLRDWQTPGFGKEKHLGYAFQWFAMSVALIIIYIVVNLRKL